MSKMNGQIRERRFTTIKTSTLQSSQCSRSYQAPWNIVNC